ncbi:hypothetical protein C8R46DRAFT_1088404 [Mycena filopes]|nr:hypothetical protein C8R46DRAFT_1088404 [Mycena filopes]
MATRLPEPVLPPELERLIFETTALLHPKAIPHLLRVARRVLIWIEPLLYRVITLLKPYRPEIRALLQKTPEFCSLAVRHLIVLDTGEDVLRLLDTCKGITSLTISFGATLDPRILPESHIRRLATQLPRVTPELRRSLFAAITHLAVLDVDPGIIISFCAEIPHLPTLTHCSFFFINKAATKEVFPQVLADSPRLHVLLLLTFGYLVDELPTVHDVRFVLILLEKERGTSAWDIWDEYWSRAEEFIAKKKRNEIEETRHWLD